MIVLIILINWYLLIFNWIKNVIIIVIKIVLKLYIIFLFKKDYKNIIFIYIMKYILSFDDIIFIMDDVFRNFFGREKYNILIFVIINRIISLSYFLVNIVVSVLFVFCVIRNDISKG